MRFSVWYSELRDRIVILGFGQDMKIKVIGEKGELWTDDQMLLNALLEKEYQYIGWY